MCHRVFRTHLQRPLFTFRIRLYRRRCCFVNGIDNANFVKMWVVGRRCDCVKIGGTRKTLFRSIRSMKSCSVWRHKLPRKRTMLWSRISAVCTPQFIYIIELGCFSDYIFGPMHFTRLDVVSSSIMRGRDNGIPSYNQLRKGYNLEVRNWNTINPDLYRKNSTVNFYEQLYTFLLVQISDDTTIGGTLRLEYRPIGRVRWRNAGNERRRAGRIVHANHS